MSEERGPVLRDTVCSDGICDWRVEGLKRYYASDESATIRDALRCVKRMLKENLKGKGPVCDYTRL